MSRCARLPSRCPTGRAAPGSATWSSSSSTCGGSAGWPAARSSWSCPTGGSVATPPCSRSRWHGCTGSLIASCGATRGPAGPGSRRSPPGWLRPFRTLTSSCPVTASPRWSTSRHWWPAHAAVTPRERPPMRDVLDQLRAWWDDDTRFALATVVSVRGSAPRQPGASMAVSAGGEAIGSVSGGCVEGAVYELASEVLESGLPVLQTYGISDEDAFSVGLTCGGILDILVRPVDHATMPTFP